MANNLQKIAQRFSFEGKVLDGVKNMGNQYDNKYAVILSDKIIIVPTRYSDDPNDKIISSCGKVRYRKYSDNGTGECEFVSEQILSLSEFNQLDKEGLIDWDIDEFHKWYEYTQEKGYFTEYDLFFALNDAYDSEGGTHGNIWIHHVFYDPSTKKVTISYST